MLRRPAGPSQEGRSVGGLIEDLLGQLGHFIDQKLNLLRLELEHNLALLVRHLLVLVIGGAIAALGLVLVAVALAFWVAGLLGSTSTGFALTGLVFLAWAASSWGSACAGESTRHDGTPCSERRKVYERTCNG